MLDSTLDFYEKSEDTVNNGSMLKSKTITLAVLFLGLNSTECYLSADSGKNNQEEISISEATKILEFADTELETPENFLTGLLDIGLIIKIEEVGKALKNSSKVSSEIRGLKLSSKIANLLKKAYRKTRTSDAPGFAFKEEVATLLGLAYDKWSEEDPLRDNFKNWTKQILGELEKEIAVQAAKESSASKIAEDDSEIIEVKSARLHDSAENADQEAQIIFREKQIRKQKPRINTIQDSVVQAENTEKPRLKKQRKNTFQGQPTMTERQNSDEASKSQLSKNKKQPLAWEQKPEKYLINSKTINSGTGTSTGNRKRHKTSGQVPDASHQLERRKPKNVKVQSERKKREIKSNTDISRKSDLITNEKVASTNFRSN